MVLVLVHGLSPALHRCASCGQLGLCFVGTKITHTQVACHEYTQPKMCVVKDECVHVRLCDWFGLHLHNTSCAYSTNTLLVASLLQQGNVTVPHHSPSF